MSSPFDPNAAFLSAQEYNQLASFVNPIMTQGVLPSPNPSEDGAMRVNASTRQQHFANASASPLSARGGPTLTNKRAATTDLTRNFVPYSPQQAQGRAGSRDNMQSGTPQFSARGSMEIEMSRLQALTVADYATFSAKATQTHAQIQTMGYLASAQAARMNLLGALQSKSCDMRAHIRLTTLFEGVDNQDSIFLFIHQITCLAFLDIRHLPLQLRSLPNVRNVLDYLTKLLSNISHMSVDQLRFCCNFPRALPDGSQPELLQVFTPCLQAFTAVHDALTHSGLHHLEQAKTAGPPPPAIALWTWLGSDSPTLMSNQLRSLMHIAWSRLLPEPQYKELLRRTERIHRKDRNAMVHRFQHQPNSRLSEGEISAGREMVAFDMNVRSSLTSAPVPPGNATSSNTTATPASRNAPNQWVNFTNEGMHANPTTQPSSTSRSASLNMSDLFFRRPPFEGLPAVARPQAALHQVHLASPPPSSRQSSPSNIDLADSLCQVIDNFVLAPVFLTAGEIIHKFTFNLSADAVASLYKDSVTEDGEVQRHYEPGKRQLRVKMSNRPFSKAKPIDHHEWVIADTYWPACVLIEVNGKTVGLRRKVHFAKDLPSDITVSEGKEFEYLKQGENIVEVYLNTDHTNPQIARMSIAVELIETKSLAALKAERRKNIIPASVTESQITQRLCGNPDTTQQDDDDDDFQFVGGDLTLKLFEPFTNNQIFTVPVRSKHCQHIDCFDLDIFLENRPRKKPGYPSNIDDWRCPLCRVDARPQSLIVDGFLVEVRKQLEATNRLDTRQISVKSDGKTWEPKQDPPPASRGKAKIIDLKHGTETPPVKSTPTEVITIDDSD